MKHTTRIARLALALMVATTLPFSSALADRGDGSRGDRYKGDRYGYDHRPHRPHYRPDHRYKGHGSYHHHHKRPVYIVAPPRFRHPHRHLHHHFYRPYWPGSTLGFVYDSFTDSWRIGGSYWFD